MKVLELKDKRIKYVIWSKWKLIITKQEKINK